MSFRDYLDLEEASDNRQAVTIFKNISMIVKTMEADFKKSGQKMLVNADAVGKLKDLIEKLDSIKSDLDS